MMSFPHGISIEYSYFLLHYLEGKRYFLADFIIDLTFSRPALESQFDFLW